MKKGLWIVAVLVLFILPSLQVHGQIPAGWNCNVLGAHGLGGNRIALIANYSAQTLVRADGFGLWYITIRSGTTDLGTPFSSPDGKTWTSLPLPSSYLTNSLGYGINAGSSGAGRIWAVAPPKDQFDTMRFFRKDSPSDDWIQLVGQPGGFLNAWPAGIAYNKSSNVFSYGLFSSGFSSAKLGGIDGTTVTRQDLSTTNSAYLQGSMVIDNLKGAFFLLSRENSNPSVSAIIQSANGKTGWTKILEGSNNFWAIASNGSGTFVLLKNSGTPRAVRTNDFVSFANGIGLPSNSWRAVAFGSSVWFAIAESGDANRFAISSNGLNWNAFQPPITDSWRVIAYANDLGAFLVLGDTYSVLCQGPPPPPVILSIKSLASDCSNAVLSWSGGVAPFNLQKSNDGVTWTNVLSGTAARDFFVSPVTSDLWRIQSSPFGRGIYSNVLSLQGLGGPCGLVVGGAPGDPNSLPNVLFGSSDPAAIQEAGLWVALLLVGILTVAGGSMGASVGLAGAGAGAGAVLGWIVSYGLGLLPLWVVIASVIVVGGALLLWRRMRA